MAAKQRLTEKAIKVLRLIADGRRYSQIVDGHSDIRYHDIFEAAEEALRLSESESDYHERKAAIKVLYPRAYEAWTDEEEEQLRRMHNQGRKPSEMAVQLKRQPSAIKSRLEKLDLRFNEDSH